ncbi:MAG: CidA/LrgA family protein [Alistipes sp.]|nr:CidA/LrgA family protein [Alistipes sp.]
MIGVVWILLCWLIGQGVSHLVDGYVSGNIVGMVLLFLLLLLRVAKAEDVRPVAKFLLGTMALFFVPYGVGLIESYRVILDNLWAIVVAAVLSTVVVLLVTGHTFQWINRLFGHKTAKKR